MLKARSLEFISDDQKFGVKMKRKEICRMLKICRDARDQEVGGILIGTYDLENRYALVKSISDAPCDSLQSRNWFQRGVQGLQDMLNYSWQEDRQFYLGEWHFHPYSNSQASPLDVQQMRDISLSKTSNCPEPILLILGGNPRKSWEISAYVFPRNQMWLRLRNVSRTCL